ncbi:MAG TPA: hypothetical protein VLJ59_04350 [Mycobacteriales bacterium]|nr:hypothetical protein [Mycobacteriales bacterium]
MSADLDDIRARAHNLATHLDLARDLARDLAHARDNDLVLDLARARDLALARARDLARVRDLARALDLDLAHALARALDLDLVLARDFAHALAHALAHAHDLVYAHDLARAILPSWMPHYRDLATMLDNLLEVARAIDRALGKSAARMGEGEQLADARSGLPGWVCRRLMGGAVRVLPAVHRPRYADEWCAELWELGGLPSARRHQLAHALRVVSRCVVLRRSLAAPVPGLAPRRPDG